MLPTRGSAERCKDREEEDVNRCWVSHSLQTGEEAQTMNLLSQIKERQRLGCVRTSYCYIIIWKWEPIRTTLLQSSQIPDKHRLHAKTNPSCLHTCLHWFIPVINTQSVSEYSVRRRTKYVTVSWKCDLISHDMKSSNQKCLFGRLQRPKSSPTSHGRYTVYKTLLVSVMSHLMQTCSLSHLCNCGLKSHALVYDHSQFIYSHFVMSDVSDSGPHGHVSFSSLHSSMDLFCCENVVLSFLT